MRETKRETFDKLFEKEDTLNPLTPLQICEAYHQARLKLLAEEWDNKTIEHSEIYDHVEKQLGINASWVEYVDFGAKRLRDILLKGE